MLNTDLVVAVVLLFHFQVTECHKQGQSQAGMSEQASFYLCAMFDEAASVAENEHELLDRYGRRLDSQLHQSRHTEAADLLLFLIHQQYDILQLLLMLRDWANEVTHQLDGSFGHVVGYLSLHNNRTTVCGPRDTTGAGSRPPGTHQPPDRSRSYSARIRDAPVGHPQAHIRLLLTSDTPTFTADTKVTIITYKSLCGGQQVHT